MSALVWDLVGDRSYESGLDKGVLYLPDGTAVPWNGLTSIIEKFDRSSSSIYYDGKKINELVSLGDFSATMRALTYPDEFAEIEGLSSIMDGFYAADQTPQLFGLCYRTQIGNDVEGNAAGYRIHILYNVTAIPKDRTHETLKQETALIEFEWDIFAIPEEIDGLRATAHYIIDTTEIDPLLLGELEEILYGSVGADASLIPMVDLVEMIRDWYRIKITDNGDGTWTAETPFPGFIELLVDDNFQINDVNAVYLDPDTYTISDTYGPVDD